MRLPLGPWVADQPRLGNSGLTDVRNAIPAKDHWLPQQSLAAASSQTLTPPIQGIWTANRLQGDQIVFVAFGGKIYTVPSRTLALVDVSGPYDYSTQAGIRWRQVQNADLSIATNYVDRIQAFDLKEGGHYGVLSYDAPKAKYIAQVRDFTVVGYTNDDLDGEDAYRIAWHGYTDGLPDPTRWTGGQSDFARINDIGQIQGLTGGEFGTVVCEQGIAVVRFAAGTLLFTIEVVERRLGTRIPNSVNFYRQFTAFYSPDGWCLFDGQSVRKIGFERIDRWFARDLDVANQDLMWPGVEAGRGQMVWAYCGQGHTGKPNRLLRYSIELDQWSKSEIELDALGPGQSFGLTLDDPDAFPNLDLYTASLDDPAVWNSVPQLVAVAGGNLAGFTGPQLDAQFTLGEFQFAGDDARAMLRRALIQGDGGTSRLMLAYRERFDRDQSWSPEMSPQSDGYFRFRIPGRSHQPRVIRSGTWANAQGLDLYSEPLGKR